MDFKAKLIKELFSSKNYTNCVKKIENYVTPFDGQCVCHLGLLGTHFFFMFNSKSFQYICCWFIALIYRERSWLLRMRIIGCTIKKTPIKN